MKSDEFRRYGYQAIDRIANYMEQLESDAIRPVQSQVRPGEIYASMPEDLATEPESFESILADFDRIIVPGITHWRSPSFFGYFPANVSGPSILGELLAAGFGVQGMMWTTSPSCTEVEMRTLDWLVQACGLPEHFRSSGPGGGVIQGSASEAAVCAMIAARERLRDSCDDSRSLCGYISTQTHSSIEKGWKVLGLVPEHLRKLETHPDGSFDVEAFRAAVTSDITAGRTPCFAVGTLGTTSTAAIDPIRDLGEICRRHGIWFHVDGAYGGSALICPDQRSMADGLDLADSYCFNPHKWLLVNFDCDCFFVADRRPLNAAMSILPEYLRNAATDSGAVIDYRDWQIPLGRRFRSLKLWMTLRWYGLSGLQRFVRRKTELGEELSRMVASSSDFELAAPPRLALVCFMHRDGDDTTREVLRRCNESGEMLLSHTSLNVNGVSRYVIRMHTSSALTELEHLTKAWRKIESVASEIRRTGLR
ncbi:MAG: pyridoxal-dependent decarboxylase [Planctomycetia bacterium]|nr:pyridoxal-dependent decarboxylase [Planctomycetia bacterium]